MATRKKAAVKKKAATAEAAVTSTAETEPPDTDYCFAAVVTFGSEGLRETVNYSDFDASAVVNPFAATTTGVSTAARGGGGRLSSDEILQELRVMFIRTDRCEMPYLRVVGRVVEVLTVHRPVSHNKDYCTSGEVFHVFLSEIPQHSVYRPDDYRLAQPNRRGKEFDVTKDPGKTGIKKRLGKLKEKNLLARVNAARDGSDRGYRLTEMGLMLFTGWPDVEGLHGDNQAGQGS